MTEPANQATQAPAGAAPQQQQAPQPAAAPAAPTQANGDPTIEALQQQIKDLRAEAAANRVKAKENAQQSGDLNKVLEMERAERQELQSKLEAATADATSWRDYQAQAAAQVAEQVQALPAEQQALVNAMSGVQHQQALIAQFLSKPQPTAPAAQAAGAAPATPTAIDPSTMTGAEMVKLQRTDPVRYAEVAKQINQNAMKQSRYLGF